MMITAGQLRALLDAEPDAQLVVRDGDSHVLTPDEVAAPENRGGLAVLSQADLTAQLEGHDPSDELLAEVAMRLDTAVDTMGG